MHLKLTIIFITSLIAALLVTFITRLAARKLHFGEVPSDRKMHEKIMPHMGGIGIFAGFIWGILISSLLLPAVFEQIISSYSGIIIASFFAVLLGAYDDLKGMNAAQKFSGEFIIAAILIFSGFSIKILDLPFGFTIDLGIWSVLLSFLWLVGLINAVNLMDGLDGLAAGVISISVIVIIFGAVQVQNWALLVVCLALLAGLFGFLKFNYHPASIFMGDTGSLFLGLLLAALSIKGFQGPGGRINIIIPIIILAIPIGDTGIAFFRRLNKGRHPFKPDKDHLHHRLIHMGLSHRQAVHIIYLAAILYGFAAYLMITRSAFFGAIVLLIVIFLSYAGLKRAGYLEARNTKKYYGDDSIIEIQKEAAPLNISRIWHKTILTISDILMINLALFSAWWIKYQSGWLASQGQIVFDEIMITPVAFILTFFWLGLFVLNDLYYLRWDVSRFDQISRVNKIILFGILVFFFVTIDPAHIFSEGRLVLLIYAAALMVLINTGRLLIIFFEKKFAALEYGMHKTLVIGATNSGKRLLKDIYNNPHLLYEPVGYICKEVHDKKFYGLSFLGTYKDIPKLIREHNIEEIIIAVNESSKDELLNIVALADKSNVIFKILPQLYDALSGHKRAEVLGHPLIRLFPDTMRLWQWGLKRFIDIFVSLFLMLVFLPFFLIIFFLQIVSGIYPPYKIVNMVGKNGRRFGMLNFSCGLKKNEERPLIGKILYYSRIYKILSLVNILFGQMSLVGPRPETEELVLHLRKKIKFYNRRFQVRPGLTGWAQVRYRYEEALKHKRDQLRQDLFYLENISLLFDLRIMLRSFFIFLFRKEAD